MVQIVAHLPVSMESRERHNDGNIRRSIEVNADRFSLSPQLVRILENTAEFLFESR